MKPNLKTVDYSGSIANSSTRVMDENPTRVYASFVNDSDEEIYLALGSDATGSKGIRLNANGGSYEINLQNPFYGHIEAICASGGKNLCVVELSL